MTGCGPFLLSILLAGTLDAGARQLIVELGHPGAAVFGLTENIVTASCDAGNAQPRLELVTPIDGQTVHAAPESWSALPFQSVGALAGVCRVD